MKIRKIMNPQFPKPAPPHPGACRVDTSAIFYTPLLNIFIS